MAEIPAIVKVNGNTVIFEDQQPIFDDIINRVKVPLRGVFKGLGVTAENIIFDDPTRKVTIIDPDKYILTFEIGKAEYTVVNYINTLNSGTHPLSSNVELINKRTMIPLREPLEKVGCLVEWDGSIMTASITTADTPVIPTEPRFFEVLPATEENFDNVVYWDSQVKAFESKGQLEYENYDDQTFIFCNFPETMVDYHYDSERDDEGWLGKDEWLGDDGFYLNKAPVKTKNFFIYASYDMRSCENTKSRS